MSNAMSYEATPVTGFKTKKDVKKAVHKLDRNIDSMSTPRILWHLLNRHKFGIVVLIALIQGLNNIGVLQLIVGLAQK